MTRIEVHLPDALYARLEELAEKLGLSPDQLVAASVANEVARREAGELIRTAASRFDPAALAEALGAVPDAPPDEGDEMQ